MSKITIDPDLSHYSPFFDDAWSQRLLIVTEGTLLYALAFDLCVSWKAQSASHSMPWILVKALQSSWSDSGKNPVGHARRLTRKMREELFHKVSFSNMKQKEVAFAMNEIVTRFENYEPVIVDMADTWKGLCDEPDFHMSLHATERNSFCTIYHDYENYLRRVIGILNKATIKINGYDHLCDLVQTFLGKTVLDLCVKAESINTARLIRHAFAHTGGAVTGQLRSISHGFPVNDGMIQVTAAHTIFLYILLSKAVDLITETALEKLGAYN